MCDTTKIPFQISVSKRKAGRYCCAYGCTGKPNEKKRGLCHKHWARLRKAVDPVYDRYNHFKNNAIKRKKEFNITLEEFRKWCDDEGYLKNGKRGKNATIDRDKNWLGYSIDNIKLITNRANIKKYWNHDRYQQPPDEFYNQCPPEEEEDREYDYPMSDTDNDYIDGDLPF
jgi:hypothetical protein